MLALLLAHGSSGDRSDSILSFALTGAVAAGFGVRALVARRRNAGTERDTGGDEAR